MEFFKKGKTKDIYKLENGDLLLRFKDTVTGHAEGQTDPGGNKVVGEIAGVGSNALRVTSYYFELLNKKGVPTHFVSSDVSKNEMVVKHATHFGKGLEFIVRYIATGSFLKRFGLYCKDGDIMSPPVYEVTLKDDDHDDPPVTIDICESLKLVTREQYHFLKSQTLDICNLIKDDLAKKGIVLYDIKTEFGYVDGKIVLIDEISAGNMRAFKDGKKLDYDTLSKLIIE